MKNKALFLAALIGISSGLAMNYYANARVKSARNTTTAPKIAKVDQFDEISAKVYCRKSVKQLLRDPDSYQFISASVTNSKADGTGIAFIRYRARNGFGGYTVNRAICTRYLRGSEFWYRAIPAN